MEPISNVSTPTRVITENDYPITRLWVFKSPLIMLAITVVMLFFGYYITYFVIAIPVLLIANPLIRKNFHYSLNEKFFLVKQGVISKKERNLPYGVIQNVFLKQDVFDRLFGLSSLVVENASHHGSSSSRGGSFRLTGIGSESDTVGASKNKVRIPGMKKSAAEELKNLILQKMKENPIDDSQSGL